jgi:hypothetical protein
MILAELWQERRENFKKLDQLHAEVNRLRDRQQDILTQIKEKPPISPELDAATSRVLAISGDWASAVRCYVDANLAVGDAIAAISEEGQPKLRKRYIGCKSYGRWGCQRCDCEYGCGPRHGHVWLRIGLVDRAAKLSADDVSACVAYLTALLFPEKSPAAARGFSLIRTRRPETTQS